jgi:hypothetical protein
MARWPHHDTGLRVGGGTAVGSPLSVGGVQGDGFSFFLTELTAFSNLAAL